MLRTLFTAAFIAFSTPVAFAQDVSEGHLSVAYRVIDALDATDRFDAILPVVAERIKAQLISNNPDIENEILMTVEEVALNMVARRGDLEREAALAYANAFSEEDLTAIADFYNTDAGTALLESGVIVTRELQQLANVWSRGVQRDMLAGVSESLNAQNLREGGVDLTGAAESAAEATEETVSPE
ncbi:MAG: DUF2059 domain-containing protein [Pseudomonadota bacterium]